MAQLYGCTAANGVWIVPGSHKLGKADIKAMVAAAGSERLPDAVPMICRPGDVGITNRQAVHGSFANTSRDWRVTVNFGFHRRKSVLGVKGGGVHNAAAVYDDERIRQRARVVGYAIDARRRRFPDETPYAYAPHAGETWAWDAAAKAGMKDYNLLDLSI
jgi:ectoine hydroxylase-related dioxygenase (phytanoyl-CoA dioxygenase family)